MTKKYNLGYRGYMQWGQRERLDHCRQEFAVNMTFFPTYFEVLPKM